MELAAIILLDKTIIGIVIRHLVRKLLMLFADGYEILETKFKNYSAAM